MDANISRRGLLTLGVGAGATAALMAFDSLLPKLSFAANTVKIYEEGSDYYGNRNPNFHVVTDAQYSNAVCADPNWPDPIPGSQRSSAHVFEWPIREIKDVIHDHWYGMNPDAPNEPDYEAVRAALWFSWGSPGFDPDRWPKTYADGTAMTPAMYRVCSHVLISDLMWYLGHKAVAGATYKDWLRKNITGFDEYGYYIGGGQDARTKIIWGIDEVPPESEFNTWAVDNVNAGLQTIIGFEYDGKGTIKVIKKSANPSYTDGNRNYSLSGVKFGIFKDRQCTQKASEMVTGSNGEAISEEIDSGTYYVKELTPGKGYYLGGDVYEVIVKGGKESIVNS